MMDDEVQVHRPRTSKSAVFSVRFPGDELWEIRRAAAAAGMSVGEFIRRAALDRVGAHETPAEVVGVMGRMLTEAWQGYIGSGGTRSGTSLQDMISWLEDERAAYPGARPLDASTTPEDRPRPS